MTVTSEQHAQEYSSTLWEREGLVLLKLPRCNVIGVGEDEVTVTLGLHAQAERTNKQTDERGLHPVEVQTKVRSQVMLLTDGGARLATEGRLCRKLECTG